MRILQISDYIEVTTMTIKLQGIPGYHPGTPVSELKAGDVIIWNYGYTSKVLSIEPTGKCSYKLTTENNGKTYERIFRGTRLVVRQTIPSVNVCKTVQRFLDSHRANIRPLTINERREAHSGAQRASNYMLSAYGQEYYTTGTIEDVRDCIRSMKKSRKSIEKNLIK